MSRRIKNFIIVDDYSFNSIIAEKMVASLDKEINVKTFQYAAEALEYVKANDDLENVTILIDIQMPYMSGFQFLEAFEELPEEKRNNYSIYIYSSTVNEKDKIQAANYKSVRQFLPKPLSFDSVKLILANESNKS